MKKLINDVDRIVRQSLEGLVSLNPSLALLGDENTVVRADIDRFRKSGKVALVTGGGAGHEPAHAGYVGQGMLTAAVSGDVFASPSSDAVYRALKAVTGPEGVLVIVKNYTGDRLNFGLAVEMLQAEGLPAQMVVVDDDAALGTAEKTAGRRGIAGTVFVHKIAGAAAEAGLPLGDVTEIARKAISRVGSMGAALSACTVPAAGKANFTIADDEMELGLGIHGEPGIRRIAMQPSHDIAQILIETILSNRKIKSGDRIAVIVNNLGSTPVMEMNIVANDVLSILRQRNIKVERAYCGTFLTAIEMAGISLSILKADDALLDALDAPTNAIAWPASAGRINEKGINIIAAPLIVNEEITGHGSEIPDCVLRAIQAGCEAIITAEPELTEMDRKVGDGDIGYSLAGGAKSLLGRLDTWRGKPVDAVFYDMGLTLRKNVGGTSGPLYAAFAIAAARALADNSNAPHAFVNAFEKGVSTITRLGGANAGDRTMVDALLPALDAISTSGSDCISQLSAAAKGARAGANATADMMPRRGRSSYIGERALGNPDPGAVAVAIWLEAAASAFAK